MNRDRSVNLRPPGGEGRPRDRSHNHSVIGPDDGPRIATESCAGLLRGFQIGCEADCSRHWRAQTVARSRSRSRDVSDPRTDPGVRVRVLEVGSLTFRLLSATLWARAALLESARRRSRAREYSPAKGGDGRPGAITPSTSPSQLCQVPREARRSTVRHRGTAMVLRRRSDW